MKAKSRFQIRNSYLLLVDIFLTIVSVVGAFALRLDIDYYRYLPAVYWMIAISLVLKLSIYYFFGLYRRLWAYASINELLLIIMAVTAASIAVSGIMLTLLITRLLNFPRMVLLIDLLLSLTGIGGFRFSLRLISEIRTASAKPLARKARKVLVIGAGDAGALVVREMKRNPQLGLSPIGYLDDDPGKQKHQIHGVPVVGKLNDLG
ncbi:MAG TPA: hypothetical protein VF352_05040, partial [Anaerolineales bacterium]